MNPSSFVLCHLSKILCPANNFVNGESRREQHRYIAYCLQMMTHCERKHRRISKKEVEAVIVYGEVIEENPDDQPFPSYLIFDFLKGKPIHVVCSYDESTDTGYVVTAYIPDQNIWSDDFRTRISRL